MTYDERLRPHPFVHVAPGIDHPELCAKCDAAESEPVHETSQLHPDNADTVHLLTETLARGVAARNNADMVWAGWSSVELESRAVRYPYGCAAGTEKGWALVWGEPRASL